MAKGLLKHPGSAVRLTDASGVGEPDRGGDE